MIKRSFDFFFSLLGLILLGPLCCLLSILILLESKGGVFYRQERIGRMGKPFKLFKFRSMYPDSDKKGLITVGGRDPRITRSGYFIRKYKLDEFPQLINVLKGEMSIVGPRPEVRKYVEQYSQKQLEVLKVRPGITDLASIKYSNENEILGEVKDPEKYYLEVIMPDKLDINLEYVKVRNLMYDLRLIFMTIYRIAYKK